MPCICIIVQMQAPRRPGRAPRAGKLQNHAETADWGEAVRRRRQGLQLTQRQVAELAGVAERTVIAVEQARGVRLEHLVAVLGVLGLHLLLERGGEGIAVGRVGDGGR
jgi:HTH-type transcriptional regulator / antitoxin HipB